MKDSFIKKLDGKVNIINEFLDKAVPVLNTPQSVIYEAMRYSLLAGGKRIRPVLAVTAGSIFSVSTESILPFACAIEMIHTYSLIHDDLPAMDNDDYRRGRYSCHKQFDEATAILAGDALLTAAFEIAAKGTLQLKHAERGARAIENLAYCAGTEGMIGGQVLDLAAETCKISEKELINLCSCKTGALLRVPVLIAAAVAGAEKTERANLLLKYSDAIGLAFQIKDDILDVEGDMKTLGKAIGSDAKDGKTTFVTLCGMEKSKKMLKELTDEAYASCDALIKMCGDNSDIILDECRFLHDLAGYLLERNN